MRIHLALVFFLGAFAASPVVFAEGEPDVPEPGGQLLHQGKLTHVDRGARSFTIETRTGPETFTLVEGGRVLGEDGEKSFGSLVVGHEVTVEAIQDETDRSLARSVQIVSPTTPERR